MKTAGSPRGGTRYLIQITDPSYTVITGQQIAIVELDPQNLILETSDSDNVGLYAWESYAINVPTSTPTKTPTRTPTRTTIGTPAPTSTATPTPSPTTDLCQPSGGGAMLTGFSGGAAVRAKVLNAVAGGTAAVIQRGLIFSVFVTRP